ncbi:MAG TPA: DUF2752 domain-containing protein [Myxococcales bacterium]|nr:DUF2752 domain-containing protein [Myxococcales bacterium]HIM02116.1 DUF2752 domain-containing protein [Myxococcales bacterium]
MSSRQSQKRSGVLLHFFEALLVVVFAGGVLFHGFGIDLLAHSEYGIPCMVHWLSGIECPGCGMTRALVLTSQFEWRAALEMNALVFLLLGFAVLRVGIECTGKTLRATIETRMGTRGFERLAVPALAITLVHWVHRLAS